MSTRDEFVGGCRSDRAWLRCRGFCTSSWPLQEIANTNCVWCMAYKRGIRGASYIAQWPCNSIAIVWAIQWGGAIHE